MPLLKLEAIKEFDAFLEIFSWVFYNFTGSDGEYTFLEPDCNVFLYFFLQTDMSLQVKQH